MKKETKRYFLVEYAGCRYKYFSTREEAEEMLKEVQKYNNRKSSSFILGNCTIQEDLGAFLLTGHYYNVLIPRSTISEIDDFTSQFTPEELLAYFQNKTKTSDGLIPDINVAYFETPSEAELAEESEKNECVENNEDNGEKKKKERIYIGIKYIPVMHKGDQKYMDLEYIHKILDQYSKTKNITFFQKFAGNFKQYYTASKPVSDLFDECNNVENMEYMGFPRSRLLDVGKTVVDKVIYEQNRTHGYERDECGRQIISRRRLRDIAIFLRDYGVEKKEPTKYNESLLHVRLEALRKARREITPEGQRLIL